MTALTQTNSPLPDGAVIGLGSNLSDRLALLQNALALLQDEPDCRILKVSSVYETPPWGKTDQPAFLNAAALVSTDLDAPEFLSLLMDVEKKLGRARRERWGPRLIDLDILTFGDGVYDQPNLRIPHPQVTERAFALGPLVDVAPNCIIAGRTASEWLSDLDVSTLTRFRSSDWFELGP